MINRFLARLSALFRGAFSNLYNVLVPIIHSNAGKLIDAALPIAIGIVAQLATSGIPSGEKRSQALSQLKAALIAQGLATGAEATTAILNLVIELAVNHLKVTTPSPA